MWELVPRKTIENVRFRHWLVLHGNRSTELQKALRTIAKADYRFFLDAFVWTYDPRRVKQPQRPWITRPVQQKLFGGLNEGIAAGKDVVIEKSRDEGASYGCLLTFLWNAFAHKMLSFAMMSRSADLVDTPSNPDSLFWKLMAIIERLPRWIIARDEYLKTDMSLVLHRSASTITGATTTSLAMVGGRKTAILIDEMPLIRDAEVLWNKSQATTNCRIANGTHEGTGTMFYRVASTAPCLKIKLPWWENPEKNKGLIERGADGSRELDFRGGKYWSPWYENECPRLGNNKQAIASELNIDPQGSGYQFFDTDELERLRLLCPPPYHEGELADGVWTEAKNGPIKLWRRLAGDRLSKSDYVIGADVATGGQGRSGTPSCASIADARTGEKVGEFVTSTMLPEKFADTLISMARWMWNAKVIWESNGPGGTLRLRFVDLQYFNVYYRKGNEKSVFGGTPKEEMGWYSTPETKDEALTEYRRCLGTGEFCNRSERALRECMDFSYGKDGHVSHAAARMSVDPSGAKANHADMVIADMLACKLVIEAGMLEKPSAEPEVTPDMFAWRFNQAKEEVGEETGLWVQ